MAEYKAFPPIICERLRRLTKMRKRMRDDRANAFENRAAAEESAADTEGEEQAKHLSEVGRLFVEIKKLDHRIKGMSNEMEDLIESPDREQDELPFSSVTVKPEDFDAPDKPDEDPEQMKMPVGKPGKKPVPPAAPELADGEQQHLAAAIGELGLSDGLLAKLIDAGYRTVGQLEKGDDTGYEGVEMSTKEFNEARKKLRAFLKQHHKAMHAAETGA